MATSPDESQDAHQQVYEQGGGYENPQEEHKGKFSHELIAGAASFEGFKLFEDQQRKEGEPYHSQHVTDSCRPRSSFFPTGKTVNHAFAKELLAGFVGGEVDKLAETHGMDEYDKIKAHRHAEESAKNMYDQHYVQGQGADEYNPNQYSAPDRW